MRKLGPDRRLVINFQLTSKESFSSWVELGGQKSQISATQLKEKQLSANKGKTIQEEVSPELLKKKQDILALAQQQKNFQQTKTQQDAAESDQEEEQDEDEEEEEMDDEEEEEEDEDGEDDANTQAQDNKKVQNPPTVPVKK